MLVGIAALVALLTAVLTGGRLSALALVELHRSYLVAAALGVQIVVISIVPGALHGLHEPAHLATYVLLAAFLWANRHVQGLALVAIGAAANAAAIAFNGGVMPASPAALETAGMPADKMDEFANSAVVHDAQLSWLGDVFALPASWPLSNVFSIGDVLIAIGLAIALHCACQSRLARALGRKWRNPISGD
jgi:hypothetical protein